MDVRPHGAIVAEDLGTWPPEQATVLLEALTKAGLSPKARRTRRGVAVTVDDSEADEAHRTLVNNMDAIARAARGPAERRPIRQAAAGNAGSEGRPLTSQRLQSVARPLGLLIVGFMLAAAVPPLRLPIVVFTVAGMIYLLGKQQPGDDERR